jgi:tetratricopeptide (TPR) repeat protein
VPGVFRIVERLDTIYRDALREGRKLLDEGRPDDARKAFYAILRMEGAKGHHIAAARLGIGDAYCALGRHGNARTQYLQAAMSKGAYWPDRARAQIGVARTYEAEGKTAEARGAYEKALTMKNASEADLAFAAEKAKALE